MLPPGVRHQALLSEFSCSSGSSGCRNKPGNLECNLLKYSKLPRLKGRRCTGVEALADGVD
jgi:hypothetical protein